MPTGPRRVLLDLDDADEFDWSSTMSTGPRLDLDDSDLDDSDLDDDDEDADKFDRV